MAMDSAEVVTVESILEDFAGLPDPRSSINRVHLLEDIIVIAMLAVIAGADGPKAIGIWAASHAQWLKNKLRLPGGIPSHDTIGRVLMALKPEAFQRCFQTWLGRLSESGPSDVVDVIAIDGKSLRRSHHHSAGLGPLFLVSAWAVRRGISLGQLATEEKSNEITAIPQLLDQIDVSGSVVTIDAAGCQTELAAKIIDGGGDYVLALKGNQGNLHQAVVDYIITQMENDFQHVKARKLTERLKGHGRKDEIAYYQLDVPEDLPAKAKWKGLRSIGVAIRYSEHGSAWTSNVRYYISSLAPSVRKFARCVRDHWAIENTLHWCLDVTFREDESRVRNRILADNIAWLKRFSISLLKQMDDKESIAMRRRMAGWNPDYLAQVLGISTT
jgi:predicted transposase YbfD/YdcC